MTICIAAMHNFWYKPDGSDTGRAIIAVTDRMLTIEGLALEYEPPLLKRAAIAPRCMLLAAGTVTVHTELLSRLRLELPSPEKASIHTLAHTYGKVQREFIAEAAEHAVLSRLRMDLATFHAQQRSMDPQEVANISMEIRDCQANITAQAIITGCDEAGAHIFHIDHKGAVHCYDDVGSCCVGSGSAHASSQFAQQGHGFSFPYYSTLVLAYSAKRAAEAAPGVGPQTDMMLITRDGVSPIEPLTFKNLQVTYNRLNKLIKRHERGAIKKLIETERKTHGWPMVPDVQKPNS